MTQNRRLTIIGSTGLIILLLLLEVIPIPSRPWCAVAIAMLRQEGRWQLSNHSEEDTSITLLLPPERSELANTTPSFSWLAVRSNQVVEYRLLISDNYGKIVFDQWIGSDTTYVLADAQILKDLNLYFWSVQANVQGRRLQSPIWSFSIDQKIGTDLVVKSVSLKNKWGGWKAGDEVEIEAVVENSGPQPIGASYVILFSGNFNSNYRDYFAHRRTISLDTVRIDSMAINDPKTVLLSAPLPYGFNHLFVTIEPSFSAYEIINANNYGSGPIIQTEKRRLRFQGLFVFYKNYFHPDVGDKQLDAENLQQIYQNICRFQRYFWDHTHILVIDVDTLHVNRPLQPDDFAFQDDQWGFYLPPDRIENDLQGRLTRHSRYDFIYVYYSWWNSPRHWSGYSGYSFKEYRLGNFRAALLAQPVPPNKVGTEEIAIHEFMHLLEHRFESRGDRTFYSPHQRALVTNFDKDSDYFDWLLETWPTERWFHLPASQIVIGPEWSIDDDSTIACFEPNRVMLFPGGSDPSGNSTTIGYKIPPGHSSASPTLIRLAIYDLGARRIRTLVEGPAAPGMYQVTWDGTDESRQKVASSLYICVLQAGDKKIMKKMLYLR